MESIQPKSSILPPVLLYASKALERASYYGIRAVLVLYMVSETMGMENSDAISVYGWITIIYLISSIVGAVVGDLLAGNKYSAFIGGLIQTIGAFVLCVPSEVTLYLGIGLVFFGSGVYGPNLFSLLGRHFRKRDSTLDSGMTIYHIMVNLGAFLGTVFIGLLTRHSFYPAFVLGGLCMLIATLLIYFTDKESNESNEDDIVNRKFSLSAGNVLIAIVISAVFWVTYELAAVDVYGMSYEIRESSSSSFLKTIWDSINPLFVFLFGILFAALWYVFKSSRFLKLGLGFLVGAIAYFILLVIPSDYGGFGTSVFVVSGALIAVAEILVAPTILALIVRYTNPKYLAIVFALHILPLHLFSGLMAMLTRHFYESPNLGLIIAGTLLIITAAAIIVYSLISKGIQSNN